MFCLCISLWFICSGSCQFDPQESVQLSSYVTTQQTAVPNLKQLGLEVPGVSIHVGVRVRLLQVLLLWCLWRWSRLFYWPSPLHSSQCHTHWTLGVLQWSQHWWCAIGAPGLGVGLTPIGDCLWAFIWRHRSEVFMYCPMYLEIWGHQ